MTAYKITWEIEVEATGPEDAAREAQRIQRDPSSTANVFGVVDPSLDPEGVWVIDLDHLPPTTSSGLFFCPECKGKRYIADGQGNWARCEACYLLSPPPPLPPAVTPATAISVLAAIHRVLDGQEWSGDTLEIIGQLMRDAGYVIRDPATTVMVEIARLDAIRAQHGFTSVWSMLDGIDFAQPHPWPTLRWVRYEAYWGDQEGPIDRLIEGTTWLDLWRAADKCIAASGDGHHIYIEHFEPRGDALVLTTGS